MKYVKLYNKYSLNLQSTIFNSMHEYIVFTYFHFIKVNYMIPLAIAFQMLYSCY